MGLKLQWLVLKQWRLPAKWKPALTILALIAPDRKKDGTDGDGSGIFVKEETFAGYLGVHRVTASKVLKQLEAEGLVVVTRRGGRWRTHKGVVGRCTERRIDLGKLSAFGHSHVATSCADHVAAPLQGPPDHVATSLHADADHVAPSLHIKTGNNLKTGITKAKAGKSQKMTGRMADVIASDDVGHTTSVRLDALRAQQQKQQRKEPL